MGWKFTTHAFGVDANYRHRITELPVKSVQKSHLQGVYGDDLTYRTPDHIEFIFKAVSAFMQTPAAITCRVMERIKCNSQTLSIDGDTDGD